MTKNLLLVLFILVSKPALSEITTVASFNKSGNNVSRPLFQNNILSLPSVDTVDQIVKYQDVKFKLNADGSWQLLQFNTLGAIGPSPFLFFMHLALVELVSTLTTPKQFFLKLNGGFNNTCDANADKTINVNLQNHIFNVVFTISRDASEECTDASITFQEVVPLPVVNLSAGSYSYVVNGGQFSGTFTLDTDNKLP
jgi:hypothetical protein